MKSSPVSFSDSKADILIVDDNNINLKTLSGILSKGGFQVQCASSASEAIASAETVVPELILLDILMPDVDGYELCRRFKNKPETADIPVIFVTALTETKNTVQGFKVGGVDYIIKPFRKENVLARVRTHLRLRHSELELQEIRTELEGRILERTGELIEANEQLSEEITGHLKTAGALKDSNQQIRLLLDSTGEAIYGLDLKGNCTFCNSACLRMLGYDDPSQLHGKCMHQLIHHTRADGTESPQEQCKIYQTFRHGKTDHCDDEVFWRSDGTCFPVEYWSHPIQSGDRVVGAVVTFLDITQRRKTEEQLRQLQKLESIGRLASGVAHDFNNILTAIRLSSEVMKGNRLELPEQLELAEVIADAVDRGAALTSQMLAVGREQKVSRQPLDLALVVDRMTQMLCRIVKENITIDVNVADSLPAIHADQGMIEQVILNLVINARDAMNERGKLRFVMESVELKPEEVAGKPEATPGQFVRMTVSDTGTGIPSEVMVHLFEPFFTTKEPGKGTGLGLAMVYGIVKQHQGWIQVESELGKGTAFHLFLPASTDSLQPPRNGVLSNNLIGGSEVILVVDDDRSVREMLKKILAAYGYHTLEAESGPKALEVWNREKDRIDLLLTDMRMPGGMNGAELIRRLLADEPKLRVIIFSGYRDDLKSGDIAEHAGINVLKKPCSPRMIVEDIRSALDEK